jgi:hypothetical protein
MSHPDYDFPCSRAFWETDAEWANRSMLMANQKGELAIKEKDLATYRELIESMDVFDKALAEFLDETAGGLSGDLHRKSLAFSTKFSDELDNRKRTYRKLTERCQWLRKSLSELTR